jgi:hypothetical protein
MNLTWMHISDLHAGMDDEKYLFPSVRPYFFDDLKNLIPKTGQVDLVLFTGDLGNYGLMEDYKEAEKILIRICEQLNKISGNTPVLAVVPGNHDLQRPGDPNDLAELKAFSESSEIQRKFWAQDDNRLRKVVESMFRPYAEWWRTTSLPKVPSIKTGILPGDFSATLEKEGHRIGIVGLNTAFLHVGDDLKGKLAVDMRQLARATSDEQNDYQDWLDSHEFSLLLTHHPEGWFSDACSKTFRDIRPPGRFAAHLFGHMHEGSASTFRDGSGGRGTLNLFQAPSLFGLEKYGTRDERCHGYCIGQIDLDQKSLIFWPRRATQAQFGGWVFGQDISIGLLESTEHTEPIALGKKSSSLKGPSKLRIENIVNALKQKDDLRSAIQIYNERLPVQERYDESSLVEMIQKHLSGNFGSHRLPGSWKAHLLVAKYAAEVVGMLLGYDDLGANFSFISYLVAKQPRPDVVNEDKIGGELCEEFLRIRKETKRTESPRFLTEVDDPARTDDPIEQQRRLARIRLFEKFAVYLGIKVRLLDVAFLQPKLNPWSDNEPEEKLILLYAAEEVSARLSKRETVEILTWTYTQLYAANMFDDPTDLEQYMEYIRSLLKRITDALPDSVELLRLQKLQGRLLKNGSVAVAPGGIRS